MSEKMKTIRDVATRYSLTFRALRFYEDKGMISPVRNGQQRLYSDRECRRIHNIARWRRANFSVPDIKKILDLMDRDETDEAEKLIEKLVSKREEQIHAVYEVKILPIIKRL